MSEAEKEATPQTPTVEDLTKEWTEEDKDWLTKVRPEELIPVAALHGRRLFALVWQSGMIGEALQRMMQATAHISKWGMKRDVQQLSTAVNVLQGATNRMATDVLGYLGKDLAAFHACKQDVERTMSLAQGGKLVQQGERVSKSGIILDS